MTVLSPRYVKSEWCRRELTEFWRTCTTSEGITLGSTARVFKAVKTPLPQGTEMSDLQPFLQPLLGYEFFRHDSQASKFHEFDLAFGPEAKAEYWLRLDDLAQDIAALFEGMTAGSDDITNRRNGEGKPVVYLAETSLDVKDQHAAIRRDLERKGYLVLPDRTLPLAAEELRVFVKEQLRSCTLSIHLIGANYGIVPDGSTNSIVELQHGITLECAAEKNSFGWYGLHRAWKARTTDNAV